MSGDPLSARRVDYDRAALDEASVAADPLRQFEVWLNEALDDPGIAEANSMTLATAGADGRPSARIVLLRGLDERGLVFFTNYESRKAAELETNPQAALVFHWAPLHRQVRIEGRVARVAASESDAYFAQRPRGHQLGAWASPQSRPVPSRADLEERLRAAEERFAGQAVARPAHWGGFRLVPERFEFWQGRPNRVHDRIAFEREGKGWRVVRLAP